MYVNNIPKFGEIWQVIQLNVGDKNLFKEILPVNSAQVKDPFVTLLCRGN